MFSPQADICNIQEDLFGFSDDTPCFYQYEKEDMEFLLGYFMGKIDVSCLEKNLRNLFEISSGAFDTLVHAWLSELPIEKEAAAFGRKIIGVSQSCTHIEEKRKAAQKAYLDRGDENTLTVLNAAAKVQHEIHRMMGLLRFTPDADGEYIAKCSADHFILPALGEYFSGRFGETSWSIIDEKRGKRLRCLNGERIKLENYTAFANRLNADEWTGLWIHYHKTINNEDRNNPDLQRQFMPKRYWKYLPEKEEQQVL